MIKDLKRMFPEIDVKEAQTRVGKYFVSKDKQVFIEDLALEYKNIGHFERLTEKQKEIQRRPIVNILNQL